MIRLTAAGCAALVLAACSSVALEDEPTAPTDSRSTQLPAPTQPGFGAGAGAASERSVAQVDLDSQRSRDPLADPNSPLSKRSIYFDFDSFVIRDEYRPVLEAHARFLNQNKGRKIVVQGNTDERGSREYNLALGQKRAEAVRRTLAALGVADGQIEAVSFGEEKPRAVGGDESAYAENRRADIVYQ